MPKCTVRLSILLWCLVGHISAQEYDIADSSFYDSMVYHHFRVDYDSAIHYALLSAQVHREMSNDSALASMYDVLAKSFWNISNFDSAMAYNIMCFNVSELLEDTLQMAISSIRVAGCHLAKEEYQDAVEGYFKSLEFFKAAKDVRGEATVYGEMGIVYYRLKDYATAKQYYQKCIALASRDSIKILMANGYNNLANLYLRENQIDSALLTFTKVESIFNDIGAIRNLAVSLSNAGSVLLESEEWRSARIYLEKSSHYFEQTENKNGLESLLVNYGTFMMLEGNYQEAEKYLTQAAKLATELQKNEQLIAAYEKMSEVNALQHKYKRAYDTRLKYDSIYLAMERTKTRESIEELRLKYNEEQYKTQLNEVTLEQQRTEISLQRSRIQRSYLLGGLTVLALLLGWGFHRYISSKKHQRELLEKNALIHRSLSENKMLLKELNHRVKNNLQIIVSLLELQSLAVDNPEANQLLDQSIKRINGILFIHQEFYQSDVLADGNFSAFLERLVTLLIDSYSEDEGFRFDLDIESLDIDKDRAIYLGMIVNEVISNAFKYGFENQKEGNLKVRMDQKDGHCRLMISDNGEGFKGEVPTSGLGMKIIRMLTHRLKGKYSFQSNEGVVFVLRFPLAS